jgi:hypothetical protein
MFKKILIANDGFRRQFARRGLMSDSGPFSDITRPACVVD